MPRIVDDLAVHLAAVQFEERATFVGGNEGDIEVHGSDPNPEPAFAGSR
jgi:hypothetical protein